MADGHSPASSATLGRSSPISQRQSKTLDLSILPPIYVLPTHLTIDEVHNIEDKIMTCDGPLTYDIFEARLVIGRVEQKKRAQLELRARQLWTEPAHGAVVRGNASQADEGRPAKKRRLDSSGKQAALQEGIAVADDSSTQSETESQGRVKIKPPFHGTTADPSPTVLTPSNAVLPLKAAKSEGLIKVVRLKWLEDSFEAGQVLPLQDYLVYEGIPTRGADHARDEREKRGASEQKDLPHHPPAIPSPWNVEKAKTILERAKADAASGLDEGPSHYSPYKHGRRFGEKPVDHVSNHGEKPSTRVAPLLHQTTSEHDEGISSDIPEMPDWVKQNKIYACERSTPAPSPNDAFIAELKKIRLSRLLTADEIGVRAYSSSIASLAAYPYTITNPREILHLPGCDVKIANLWVEWKNNDGRIKAVERFEDDEEMKVIRVFYEIWGVGERTAREFYHERGWRDLDDIVDQGWNTLTRVQQIGVKYYDEFLTKIPRSEVEFIGSKILEHARRVRDDGIEMCIVGGYRRGKAQSGDVDLIISHRDKDKTFNVVTDIVASLETEGWITHTLLLTTTTSKRDQNTLPYRGEGGGHGYDSLDKALVVWQDPDWPNKEADLAANPKAKNPNIHRRVDIIISPWRTVGCAIAGWSAETTFQRDLRRYAKNVKGWKFDSSGVRDRSNGDVVDLEAVGGISRTWLEAEKKVFEGLGPSYSTVKSSRSRNAAVENASSVGDYVSVCDMDFWTRLLSGGTVSQRRSTPTNPQQRLARFKRVYNQILHAWHTTPSIDHDTHAANTVRSGLQRLTTLLHDESRGLAPYLCLSYAESSQIYAAVSRIASRTHNEGIIREALALFSTLVDTEEEEFLGNDEFAKCLITLVQRVTGSGQNIVGAEIEADVVELLFGITAKIRLQPQLLSAWFSSNPKLVVNGGASGQKSKFVGLTQKEDFPLCYELLEHVHHEGRVGDFARTGLLYIFECASMAQDLEQWIVESDLATLMASGLGALYSQLSRKLSIRHPIDDLPPILALSDYVDAYASSEAQSYLSTGFQTDLKTFLSCFTFWQDVMEHCRSMDIRQTLIDHFQILFLQQLLYPTMLESSDVDGGSAVAVLTYLRQILDSVNHPDLIRLMLSYLLALPEDQRPRSPEAEKKRQSLRLLAASNGEVDPATPALFNLVDLIITGVQSQNSHTVIAALKLATTILSQHCTYALHTLLRVDPIRRRDTLRTVGAFHAEIEEYLGLSQSIGGADGIDGAYDNYLKDVHDILEARSCSQQMLALTSIDTLSKRLGSEPMLEGPRQHTELHGLAPADPLSGSLLNLLKTFFTNDVETNLSLTEVIITLASCAFLRLEGYIAVDPSKYQCHDEDTAEEVSPGEQSTVNPGEELDAFDQLEREQMKALAAARRQPTWSPDDDPPVLAALKSLVKQIEAQKATLPEFDALLAQRKQIFRTTSQLDEALDPLTPNPFSQAGRASTDEPGLARRTSVDAIPQRLRESETNVSEASSPRAHSPHKGAIEPERNATGSAAAATQQGQRGSAQTCLPIQRVPETQTTSIESSTATAELLKRKLRFPSRGPTHTVEEERDEEAVEISLNHFLTNVVVLQEFILELTALIQIRATLFREIKFV